MKAAYIDQPGSPEQIRYGDLPMPIIGKRDVLVKALDVTVDAIDTSIRSGAFQMTLPFLFIIGSIILTVLWVYCFLVIRPTLVIDFGAGLIVNFKLAVILLGLLVIVLYHTFYRSSAEATKLSLTVALTISWLALTFFYPYLPQQGTDAEYEAGILYGGAVGFFDLIGGLAVCVRWIHFFCDEVSLKSKGDEIMIIVSWQPRWIFPWSSMREPMCMYCPLGMLPRVSQRRCSGQMRIAKQVRIACS